MMRGTRCLAVKERPTSKTRRHQSHPRRRIFIGDKKQKQKSPSSSAGQSGTKSVGEEEDIFFFHIDIDVLVIAKRTTKGERS